MRSRSTKVCRWCLQPLPAWTDAWPHNPGIYLFYGYPINIKVDKEPRLMMVTVETYSDTFGTIWPTARSSLKPQTGAAGYFMPLMVPNKMPSEEQLKKIANESAKQVLKLRVKRLNKKSARRLK
jgi:hypothetical protein